MLKVTDDSACLKYRTDSAADLKGGRVQHEYSGEHGDGAVNEVEISGRILYM